MSSIFNELFINKNLVKTDLGKCINHLKKDLEMYSSKSQSEVKDIYSKLITKSEYYNIQTKVDESPTYDSLLKGWLLAKLSKFKEINLSTTKAVASAKFNYEPVIKIDKSSLPGNYTDKVDISKFDLSTIQAGGDIGNVTEFLNNPSFEMNKQSDEERVFSNMRILYDFSASLYNDDIALKLCSIMVDPIKFGDMLKNKFDRNKKLHKEILEYFFHPVPIIPEDVKRLLDVKNLPELYIFTSQRVGTESPEIYENKNLTMLKYDDCLLDSTLFKNLYNEVIGPEDSTFNNSSLFVFSFRLITNFNKIVNRENTANFKSDKYYFTTLVNTMTELQHKNVRFSEFLKNKDYRFIINESYEAVMKEIAPVNIYIKVNNMPQRQKDGSMKTLDTTNPRYIFDIDSRYVRGGTGSDANGRATFNPQNYTPFFKDIKLTYKNCAKKVGFNENGEYSHDKAVQDLNNPEFKTKIEKYNLGKINGFYNDNDEVIDDPNCCGLLLDKIDRGENAIIVGNGQSGSGKTASLVYLAYGDVQGILPTILNKLDDSYVRIDIRLADIYFNWDPNLKAVRDIRHKHYMVKPIKLNGVSDFTFKKKDGIWNISTDDLVKNLLSKKSHDHDENEKMESRANELRKMSGNLAKIINDLFNLREIEPTKNNPNSSRSHVLVLTEIYKASDLNKPHSKIVICDLAGVEDEFTCNCEQLVNLLNIYRTKSDKYSHKELIDDKLYFDNFTCFIDDEYRSENQTEYLKPENKELTNLTIERSKIIYRLYKFASQVNYQLSTSYFIKPKKGVPAEIKIYDEITNSNLDSFNPMVSLESYDQILYSSSSYFNNGFKCINQESEKNIRSLLQNEMINTSGPKNLMTNFYSFYRLKESDNIETVLNHMFALYNIYMRLYEFVFDIVYYKETGIDKADSKDPYALRYDAVKKINAYNDFNHMGVFVDKKYENQKSLLVKIFIEILSKLFLKGILLEKPGQPGAKPDSMYYKKTKDKKTDKEACYTTVKNFFTEKFPTDKAGKDWFDEQTIDVGQPVKLKKLFQSDSVTVLYTIFFSQLKATQGEWEALDDKNKPDFMYSAPICKAFVSSVGSIIKQIVGDIIRIKIMDFNCKLRRKEGYFINRSLAEMQKSLSTVIVRELNDKTVKNYSSQINVLKEFPNSDKIKDKLTILNYVSPSSDNCYKDNYMYNDFTFKNLMFDKTITIPTAIQPKPADDESEVLLRIIFDNGYLKDQDYIGFGLDPRVINKDEKRNLQYTPKPTEVRPTSIMVFTVINLTDNGIVNNSPNPPYLNTNNLKRIYNISKFFDNLLKAQISKNENISKELIKYLEKLDAKFMKYRVKFILRGLTYEFYMKNKDINEVNKEIEENKSTFGKLINKDTTTGKVSIENQQKTLDIIDFIDGNNKTTLIGTISFDVFTQPRDYKNYKFYICDGDVKNNNNETNFISTNPVIVSNYDAHEVDTEPVNKEVPKSQAASKSATPTKGKR
jgi:hypothetical protein